MITYNLSYDHFTQIMLAATAPSILSGRFDQI